MKYIRLLLKKNYSNHLYFDKLNGLTNEEIINELKTLPGICEWTVKMYLIFYLERLDILSYEDTAFKKAFTKAYGLESSRADILKVAKNWGSYSSIAARILYRALDSNLLPEEL